MKKVLFAAFAIIFSFSAFAQDFPYEKMLNMTPKELKEHKFKFNEDKNQWILRKSNGLNTTANILSAINGQTADIKPSKDDYQITIQNGDEAVSSVEVIFYNDDTYHELLTFANDNGTDLLSTNSGDITKTQFNYGNNSFIIQLKRIGSTATTGKTSTALVKTIDESYNMYNFTILTGVEPSSDFLKKEAAKEQRRDSKNKKKRSVNDLM